MKRALSFTVHPAMPLDRLRNGLASHHLPARVSNPLKGFAKVWPGQGIDRERVKAFVEGFIAGFEA